MKTRVSLKPGDKGTRQLQSKYGEQLVCVRYRYDPKARMRYKTVELIVDARPYVPENSAKFFAEVLVRIGFEEQELRDRAKALGARWEPEQKKWRMRFNDALDLGLQDRLPPIKNGL
jgi:hypothetical protein